MKSAELELPALSNGRIRLAELLGALSHALDLTEGQSPGHCVRCCWIGMHIGQEIALSEAEQWELYYAILLKDLGCSSNAARICRLYIADDLSFKRDYKTVDGSVRQALSFVLSHTGLKAGLSERFSAVLNILRNGGEIARDLIDTRCHRGAEIARRMRFSEAVADGIQHLDEHWDGGGAPLGLARAHISVYARIALLAQVIDVFLPSGKASALKEVRSRAGTWFDPSLVEAFERVANSPAFWEGLEDESLQKRLFDLEPARQQTDVDEDYMDDIASAFAQVIDAKSPFTSGHSERVTVFTDLIAGELGLTVGERRRLKRVALLHDIGKLGVSNAILDKPGKLDELEWAAVKMHPVHSEQILSQIEAFRGLAPIAGGHHERLDGKGYPRGLAGEAIPLETRIITTADIFDALTAERPYRAALPIPAALKIMSESVGTAIDRNCFDALGRSLKA